MGKITERKLVGQPIFKQIMNLVDKVNIQELINKHDNDYYANHSKPGHTLLQFCSVYYAVVIRRPRSVKDCNFHPKPGVTLA